MRPTPKRRRDGRWGLDLRWDRFGQYVLDLPPEAPEIEALHAAYALHARLKDERTGTAAQVSFHFGAGPLVREVADLYWKGREAERLSADNVAYWTQYLAAVKRELGHMEIGAFAPPDGDALLVSYRNDCADRKLGPRTRRNRLNAVMALLKFAHGRGWLPAIPVKPDPTVGAEVLNDPEWRWYAEADFRKLRSGLYEPVTARGRGLVLAPEARAARLDRICRRRLYLSFGFYGGLHTRSLDLLTDANAAPELGHFLRENHKSAKCIAPRMFRMPEQLQLDCIEELQRLGRHWHGREPIAGGPWNKPTRWLHAAAVRGNLPVPIDFRILRRSTAYHLCLLGWPEEEVAEYLGHVDRQMVNAVYRRVPVDIRSRVRLDWTNANMASVTGALTARARIISFPKPVEAK